MTTASAHEVFATSAEVAGALIGLLFVAISVSPERILGPNASEIHSMRAILVIVCFLIGIARAWELVGGQRAGLTRVLIERLQKNEPPAEPGGAEED